MVQAPSKRPRKATMLRLDAELYDQLFDIAKREQRSVNQQITLYIRKMLDARTKKNA